MSFPTCDLPVALRQHIDPPTGVSLALTDLNEGLGKTLPGGRHQIAYGRERGQILEGRGGRKKRSVQEARGRRAQHYAATSSGLLQVLNFKPHTAFSELGRRQVVGLRL